MKKLITILMVVLANMPFALAQPNPDTLWTKTYGGEGDEVAHFIQQTTDGGYIIAGYTTSFGAGLTDFYIMRTNSVGDTMWTRTFGDNGYDEAQCIRQTSDGGFIAVGYTRPNVPNSHYDILLIKIDSMGDSLWTRQFGESDNELAYKVIETRDYGFAIIGYKHYPAPIYNNMYFIKTDSLGDTVFTKTYGGSQEDIAYSILQIEDGGYVIIGKTRTSGASRDFYIVRTDSTGDVLWTRTYGSTSYEAATSIFPTSDRGYIIEGDSECGWPLEGASYLVKVDSLWNTQWERRVADDLKCVQQVEDGGYILVGLTGSWGALQDDFCLTRLDELGHRVWTRSYGGAGNENAHSIVQIPDGGYLIAGSTESFGAGGKDFYLVRTGSEEPFHGPQIDISRLDFYFGIFYNEQQTLSSKIVSTGDTTLIIYGMHNSNPVFHLENDLTGSNIAPGQRTLFEVTFTPPSLETYYDTLYIESNAGTAIVTFEGEGLSGIGDKTRTVYPELCTLSPAYPNPFNTVTRLSYNVGNLRKIKVKVYDVLGKEVTTLLDQEVDAGYHQVVWNAGDLPSGIYFVRLEAGEFVQTRKVVLLK